MAWVGIGCGGILVIILGLSVFAFFKAKAAYQEFRSNPEKVAAQFLISQNPDLKMLSHDEKGGTMTLRLKDGKDVTLSYKDIVSGKIAFTDAEGNATTIGSKDLSKIPAWVPRPNDLADGISLFHAESATEISGQYTGSSSMNAGDLLAFFEANAPSSSASGTHKSLNGVGIYTHEFRDDARTLKLVISEQPGAPSSVSVNYSEKR